MEVLKNSSAKVNHGKNIQKVRKQVMKITQKELAERMGIGQQKVSKMEKTPEIEWSLLQKAADAMGVKPELLRDLTTDASNYFMIFEKIEAVEGDEKKMYFTNEVETLNITNETEFFVNLLAKIREDEQKAHEMLMEQNKNFYEMQIALLKAELEKSRK